MATALMRSRTAFLVSAMPAAAAAGPCAARKPSTTWVCEGRAVDQFNMG